MRMRLVVGDRRGDQDLGGEQKLKSLPIDALGVSRRRLAILRLPPATAVLVEQQLSGGLHMGHVGVNGLRRDGFVDVGRWWRCGTQGRGEERA